MKSLLGLLVAVPLCILPGSGCSSSESDKGDSTPKIEDKKPGGPELKMQTPNLGGPTKEKGGGKPGMASE